MDNAMEPGRVTFDDKMAVRKAIQEAGIPFTYVSANCFAGYFVGGLCQPGDHPPFQGSCGFIWRWQSEMHFPSCRWIQTTIFQTKQQLSISIEPPSLLAYKAQASSFLLPFIYIYIYTVWTKVLSRVMKSLQVDPRKVVEKTKEKKKKKESFFFLVVHPS